MKLYQMMLMEFFFSLAAVILLIFLMILPSVVVLLKCVFPCKQRGINLTPYYYIGMFSFSHRNALT